MIINTNVSALFAENALNQTSNQLQSLQQELATGYQINSPADNPAGLAIANLMTGELGGISSAIQNANQATNLLQTANGGIQNDMQIVQQIQQLAVQAANGTQTTQDQQDIQSQINSLLQQLDNNAQSINYNNLTLLDGQFGASVTNFTSTPAIAAITLGPDMGGAAAGAYSVSITVNSTSGQATVEFYADGSVVAATTATVNPDVTVATVQTVAGVNGSLDSFVVTFNPSVVAAASAGVSAAFSVASSPGLQFQVGPEQGSQNVVTSHLGVFTAYTLGLANLSVVGASNAQYAITLAQNALSMLTNAQGAIGSQLDELNYTISNLQTESNNLQASKSTIMDANMAVLTAEFSQEQVLQQTGLQALTAAEQLPQMVLKLLG